MTNYTLETWMETFKPIVNHLDENASWQNEYMDDGSGIMFETYGEELEFVILSDDNKVWTYMDDDYGNTIIVAGYHLAGRIGYFITEVARDPKDEEMWDSLCIMVSENQEEDEEE